MVQLSAIVEWSIIQMASSIWSGVWMVVLIPKCSSDYHFGARMDLVWYSNGVLNNELATGHLPAIVKVVIQIVPFFECRVFGSHCKTKECVTW